MSTKTTFKRIALVAVAALGLGVLSVAPSQAATSGLTVTTTNGTATTRNSDSSTAASVTLSFLAQAGGESLTVSFVQRTALPATAAIASAVFRWTDSSTVTGANIPTFETATATLFGAKGNANASVLRYQPTLLSDGSARIKTAATTNLYQTATWKVDLGETTAAGNTIVAGTYGFTAIVSEMTSTGAITTVTKDFDIVVSAVASESETPSAAYSTVFLGDAATTAPSADALSVNGVSTAGTTAANLYVKVRNALDGATGVDTVTITVTGPGLITNGTTKTKYAKVVATSGNINYPVSADGTSGVATIKVAYELTGQIFTKTVTFYDKNATTITGSVRTPTLKVGANSEAVGVTATDSNGNAWTGTAYLVASSAADALIAGSTTPVACNAWTVDKGIRCDVTAIAAGTAKFKLIDASSVLLAKATSAEFSLTSSVATAATVKVEFDKTTYAPYEKAVITVSALDAAGASVPAGTFATLFAAGGISSTQSFSGTSDTLTPVSITTSTASSSSTGAVALKKVYTVYMPAQGDVTLSWTGGASLPAAGQVKGSTTVSIVNNAVDAATDAANEATDAANAATDAALAAADAADAATAAAQDASDAVAALSATVAKLVASLKAQITSLTNLVIKIQKKDKA
jgi:hypothetical protein